MFTTLQHSPGRMVNRLRRSKDWKFCGKVGNNLRGAAFQAITKSGWVEGTTSLGKGMLVVWTAKGGLVYRGVKPQEVGAIHGGAFVHEPREPTHDELMDLLRRSIEQGERP